MATLALLFPILALALAGYISARSGFLQRNDCETLSRFTFNLVIPCLLFVNTATSDIPDDFGLSFLLAFYSAVLLLYGLSMLLGALLFSYNNTQQAVFAMGTSYSNTTIVGIPLVLQTLGPDALLPLFLIIAVQNLLLFTVGTLAVEKSRVQPAALLRTLTQDDLRQRCTTPAGSEMNVRTTGSRREKKAMWSPYLSNQRSSVATSVQVRMRCRASRRRRARRNARPSGRGRAVRRRSLGPIAATRRGGDDRVR